MSTTEGTLAKGTGWRTEGGNRGPSRGTGTLQSLKALDPKRASKATYPTAYLLPSLSPGHGDWRLVHHHVGIATHDLAPLMTSGSTQQGSENGPVLPALQQGPGRGGVGASRIISLKTGSWFLK